MNEKQIKRDRIKHPDNRCKQPWFKWKWERFPGTPTNEEMDKDRYEMEREAEFETDGDLVKPIPQLVCDFNFEAQKSLKEDCSIDTRLLLNAQKRMVAMMAQVAMESRRISRWMLILTIAILLLTLLTVIMAWRDNFKQIINDPIVIKRAVNETNISTNKRTNNQSQNNPISSH